MDTRRRAIGVVVGIVVIFALGRWFIGGESTPEAARPTAETQVPAAGPIAPVKLLSHRAVYDLKLKSARSNSGVTALDGRMVMEWADSCDGSTLNQRIQTRAYDGEGNQMTTDFRISTWESKDGGSFRFSARQETDGEVTEEFDGRGAKGKDGAGIVTYAKPPKRKLDLAAGTLFPTEHTNALIKAASAAQPILSAKVFDGSGPDTTFESVAVIGKEIPGGSSSGATGATSGEGAADGSPLLSGMRSWPMRLAYFPAGATDGLPEYEIGFRMFANGVSTDLELDYGDFTVSGLLTKIEALPDPGC